MLLSDCEVELLPGVVEELCQWNHSGQGMVLLITLCL
jgi:hypothetical protein